jgi:ATP-binding cassette subfamily B protein
MTDSRTVWLCFPAALPLFLQGFSLVHVGIANSGSLLWHYPRQSAYFSSSEKTASRHLEPVRNPLPAELLWLYKRVRHLFAWHLASFLCLTAGSALALLNPLVLMWVIDRALPARNLTFLFYAAVLIFLSYEGRVVLTCFGSYLTLRATQRSALSMRMEVLKHLDSLSADYHENTAVGARLYPLREPIEEIAYFGSDLLPTLLRTALITAFTLSAMFLLNPRLTVFVLPAIPAFLIARYRFRRLLAERSDTMQADRTNVSAFLQEHISSIVQIQSLQQEKRQERLAFHSMANAARSQVGLALAAVQFTVWTSLPIAAAAAVILGSGAWTVLQGAMTVGGLVAFYGYIFQLFDPLSGALETYARAQRTFSSIRQIQAMLSLRPSVSDNKHAAPVPFGPACPIRFKNVSFGYPRQRDFVAIPRLLIESGEHVAIVGENGAGKSTFAKLAARLYDPDSGSVTIGDSDARDIPLKQFRSLVSYVPATPVLFDDTLTENLRLGSLCAGIRQIEEVTELVDLCSFVEALPRGWSEPLGPSGGLLSGGQRQRLALARALLRRPRILILDEATSGLDPAAELLILRRIPAFLPGTTILFVSHRLANVTRMDRILVFQQGRIAEDGSHHVLQAAGKLYAELQRTSKDVGPLSMP